MVEEVAEARAAESQVPAHTSSNGTGGDGPGAGLLVILPTYNERENVVRLLDSIRASVPAAHVLLVDDGSPDGTADLARAWTQSNGGVEIMERAGKLGLGTAYVAGFRHALEHGYAFALTMDADFSHHPRFIPALLGAASQPGVDLAVGSRYVPGGGIEGWGLQRRVLSFGANLFARTMLRLQSHDCTGGFRCYRRSTLEGLDLDAVFSHGYSALIELLWRCQRAGFRLVEVPIVFRDRVEGVSKISHREISRGLTTVLRLCLRRAPARRPEARGVRTPD
jgi:glycosyltransferase involved in cell wall biosynthesis